MKTAQAGDFRNKAVRRDRRFTNCKEERNGERYGLLYAFAPQEGPLAAFLVDGVLPLLYKVSIRSAEGAGVNCFFPLFWIMPTLSNLLVAGPRLPLDGRI